MTDRINAITVVLAKEIREDDAEPILNAIRMLKGVISVEGNVADIDDHIAIQQARFELREKLKDVLWPK